MKKYTMNVHYDMCATVEVYAESLDEAEERAEHKAAEIELHKLDCCDVNTCVVDQEPTPRYYIEFECCDYIAADYDIMVDGESMHVTVADTDLEADLYDADNDVYSSQEAQVLDESIAFYIKPEEWNLSDAEIIKIVEKSYR